MLIFIDESGDAGFKIDKGASPIFVVAMVIFATREDAAETQEAILRSEVRKNHKAELKFNKCSYETRDRFFQAVRNCPFSVQAVVARKEIIHSSRLRTDEENFYNYFITSMLRYDKERLKDALIVIDGLGRRATRNKLSVQLRRRLGAGVIADLRFKNSKSDVLIQLADMCAGAIARSYRNDRPDSSRWRALLAPRIQGIWDIQ